MPRAEALTSSRTTQPSRGFLRQAPAASQIAISLVLITAATLLLQSFRNIEAVPLGISPSGLLAATISLGDATYPDPLKQQAFFDQLESRLRQIPGIDALAATDSLPPSGAMRAEPFNALQVAGQPRHTESAGGMAAWRAVTPDYFATLKIPIVRGRAFEEKDRDSKENVIILSQTLANRLFGETNPLGRNISLEPDSPWYSVIGVAENVKNGGILEPDDPEYYLVRKHAAALISPAVSSRQFSNKASYLIRSSLATATIATWLRNEVAAQDPTLPLTIESMNERVSKLTAQPRFNASLLSLFATISLALAAILAIPIALLAIVTMIAAWIPAHRAASIDPVEALRRE